MGLTAIRHSGAFRRFLRLPVCVLAGALCLTPGAARAQDWSSDAVAAAPEFFGELPEFDATPATPPVVLADGAANLFVAIHRTAAQRYSDTYLTSGQKRRRSIAASIRLRRQDDANFTNRTRFLARRVEEMGRPVPAPQRAVATTGEEFLATLIEASRRAPIANLVIYGHAAANALFAREDRGFYASVREVAKASHIVSGDDIDKDEQLRLAGARDLSDFEWLLARGDIRFTASPVIVFAGCGVAGRRDIEPNSIAARMAEITGAKVIASIDVTDQSMGRGANFRNHEYSRRSWVRFARNQPPERLNTKVIDALKQLNFDGAAVASVPAGGQD
ncbi:MAG TPA: hypothetical protein VJT13_21660 [Xanthobacteraceae bacterium]|nr:hypothetical protein [Xanthobacteraceae bacterium]